MTHNKCLLSKGVAGDRGEQGPPGVNGFQVCCFWMGVKYFMNIDLKRHKDVLGKIIRVQSVMLKFYELHVSLVLSSGFTWKPRAPWRTWKTR